LTIELNEINKFKHVTEEKVKFHEVDMMNVCNNAVYFNYFEDARIKYIQDLKKNYELKEILENGLFFIMAHNECDYFIPAMFDDELSVLTRIDFIKKTSFGFRHLVVRKSDNQILASGKGVLVHINFGTKKKVNLPDEFYSAVKNYEDEVTIKRE
jgi:acyl-CoA thioester hydrolase